MPEANYWTRTSGGRFSRRGLLRSASAAGLGLAGAGLIGCGGEDEAPPAPAATQPSAGTPQAGTAAAGTPAAAAPKTGGIWVEHQSSSFSDVLDPHISTYLGSTYNCTFTDHAVRHNDDASEVLPQLFQSWEMVGDLEMVVTVEPKAKWHNKPPVDGRQLDAEDLAYNILRIAGRFAEQEGNDPVRYQRRTTILGVEDAQAIDEKQLRITFERPTSTLLNGLADFRNNIVPRDFLEKGETFDDPASQIGTGPFIVEQFENEVRATFKRNPEYWQEGLPYLDGVDWVWIPDATSAQAAFINGDIHQVPGNKQAREVILKQKPDTQVRNWNTGVWSHLRFNTAEKPFDDPRVRKALGYTLDYKKINDDNSGEGFWRYTGPLSDGFAEGIPSEEIAKMPGWNPNTKEQDIATAKQLMDAAGYPTGQISFAILNSSPTNPVTPIRAKDMWESIWPDMEVAIDLPPDLATFHNRQVTQDFQMISYGLAPQPDAVLDQTANYHSKGSRNYNKFSDPKFDELLDKAFGQLVFEERKATLLEFQHYLIDDPYPIIHLVSASAPTLLQPNVRGVEQFGWSLYSTAGDSFFARYMWFDK